LQLEAAALPLHQGLLLLPSCVPKKLGVNITGVNQKRRSHEEKTFKLMGINQPKSVKPKTRGRKLRSVNWQGAFEQKA